jgi:hypothetical protein
MFHGKRFNAPPACSFAGAGGRRGVFQARLQWVYAEAGDEKNAPPRRGGGN